MIRRALIHAGIALPMIVGIASASPRLDAAQLDAITAGQSSITPGQILPNTIGLPGCPACTQSSSSSTSTNGTTQTSNGATGPGGFWTGGGVIGGQGGSLTWLLPGSAPGLSGGIIIPPQTPILSLGQP